MLVGDIALKPFLTHFLAMTHVNLSTKNTRGYVVFQSMISASSFRDLIQTESEVWIAT